MAKNQTTKGTMEQSAQFGLDSITPVIKELERAAQWFTARNNLTALASQRHTVVIYTGSKTAKCYGWFRGKAKELDASGKETGNLLYPWYRKDDDGSHQGVCEIMLNGEDLNRPVMDILATLFHELGHATAEASGVQDTAKSGRHNKKFAEIMDKLGLDTVEDDKGSWRLTSMRPSLINDVESELKPDFDVFRLAAGRFAAKPKGENKLRKYVCNCETGVQRKGAEFRTYRAAVLRGKCYDCEADFRESKD